MRPANDGDNGDDYCENAINNIICYVARTKEKVEVEVKIASKLLTNSATGNRFRG